MTTESSLLSACKLRKMATKMDGSVKKSMKVHVAVCLLYHDDRVILAPSACKLRKMATKMDGSVKKGMKVHVGKTKMMVLERVKARHNVIKEGEEVEQVKEIVWNIQFQVIVLGKRMKERQYNGHALYQWRMSIVLLDLRS
ncbi:hypothetical protein EVAR_100929_1 [Eumeta japonica]|uniref:Reverse transcriptase domain-containing protein n=1 Tax=Eumeta variegata TaxID=151549 RepID=A0A4C2ACQ3_EUMVA|nr:hypothetical protein EVAR_100929_1 [Eumeta japonica]